MPIDLQDLLATAAARELMAIVAGGEWLLALDADHLGRAARVGDGPSAPASVGVLKLHGAITPRGSYGMEGWVSKLNSLAANPDVAAIVIDGDTPGGTVAGTQEAADAVKAATKVKPVYAIADTLSASAGYWIMSQASQFWATPSAEVGSIGAMGLHVSIAKALEDAGIKATIVKSSKFKAERSPLGELSPEAQSYLQSSVDEAHSAFVKAVAEGRKVSRDKVANDFGQGRVMSAPAALKAGMIDHIGTMSDLMASLRTKTGTVRRRASIF